MKSNNKKTMDVEKALDQVEEALEAGEIDQAVEKCEEVLAFDKENVQARLYLAEISLEDGDAARVLELCQEALERDPDCDEARILMAESYLALEDPENAIQQCDTVLQHDPDNLEARFFLAESFLDIGSVEEAVELYDSIVEQRPDHLPSLLGLGVALYESCRFEESEEVLAEAIEQEEELPDAHFFLGLILERRGDDLGALRAFSRARDLDPENYPYPLKMSIEEFEKVIEDVQAELPERLRNYLENVPISVEELPSDDDLKATQPPLSPNIWGLFRGQHLEEHLTDPFVHLPSEIVLFRRNLQRSVRTRQALLEEIKVTLQHEIAHFLGLDEQQVAELGLA